MKVYRMSPAFLFTGIVGGAIVGAMYTIGRPHPLAVFVTVEGLFTFFTGLSWASTGVFFDGDKIVRRAFFLSDTAYPIRDIKRVRFDRNEDSFGGIMPTVTIEVSNAKRIMLISFRRADVDAILERIKLGAPDINDKDVVNKMNEDDKKMTDWRSLFRPGDGVLFVAGTIVALLAVLWWTLHAVWSG
jgi:hypothetical protein